jgi:hypothetical protein
MAQPELLPVAMAVGEMEKHDPARKARAKMKAAQGQLLQKYGIAAIAKPRFWILLVSKAFLWKPLLTAITIMVAGLVILACTFGSISVVYFFHFVRSAITVVPNAIFSVLNAVWFAVHGIYYMIVTAVLDIANGILHFALSWIVDGINYIAGILTLGNFHISVPVVGRGLNIEVTPGNAFGYLAPSPMTVKYGSDMHIDYLGTFFGMWGFVWIKPGASMYMTDAQGGIVMDEFYSENGAGLFTPRMNPDGIADGIWAKVVGPPPITHGNEGEQYTYNYTIPYVFDWRGTLNSWYTMITTAQEAQRQSIGGERSLLDRILWGDPNVVSI